MCHDSCVGHYACIEMPSWREKERVDKMEGVQVYVCASECEKELIQERGRGNKRPEQTIARNMWERAHKSDRARARERE